MSRSTPEAPVGAGRAPAPAPAPTATLPLTAADGHRFAAALFLPDGAPRAALAFFPALGTLGRFYHRFAAALAAEGVAVAVPDWRGAGSSDRRPGRGPGGDHGFAELLEADLPALVAALAARLPGVPVFVGGHSLGGQLAGLFAARHPARVAGAVLVASGTIHARAYAPRTRAGVLLLSRLAPPVARALGYFPGRRFGFGGREAAGVMADWSRVARDGRYRPAGSAFDCEGAVATSPVRLLVLNFPRDAWSPPAAGKAYLAKFRRAGAGSRQHVWDDRRDGAGPEGAGFDHFSWARAPQAVAGRVAAWMRENAGLEAHAAGSEA